MRYLTARPAALILLAAAAIRLPLWWFGQHIEWPDTVGYMRMADRFYQSDWAGYNAQRTPGYAWLILAAGQHKNAIWAVQLVLGAAIGMMVYGAARRYTNSPAWPALAALAYVAGPHFVIYESSILTETWCTFLMLLALTLYIRMTRPGGRVTVAACAGLGVVMGLSILTRPLQVILIPAFGWALLRSGRAEGSRSYRYSLACITPAVLAVLLWSGFNKAMVGSFTLSTLNGVALLNVAAEFVEKADPRHAALVSIIVPHRDALMRSTGSAADVGWIAYRDLKTATGLDDIELSKALTALSMSAIVAAPGEWLRVVARGWARFWFAPGGLIRSRTGSHTLGVLAAAPYIFLNFCFLAVTVVAAVHSRARARFAAAPGLWVIVAIVAAASVLQAVTESTAGTRYAVPYQPLYFITLAAAGSWFTEGASRAVVREAPWA